MMMNATLRIRSHGDSGGIVVGLPFDPEINRVFGTAFQKTTMLDRSAGGYVFPSGWVEQVKRWAKSRHCEVIDERVEPTNPDRPEDEWPHARECSNCQAPVPWQDPGTFCPHCGIQRSGATVLRAQRKDTAIITRSECPSGHAQTAREPYCRTCGQPMVVQDPPRPLFDEIEATRSAEPYTLGDLAATVRGLGRIGSIRESEGLPTDEDWRLYREFWDTIPRDAERPTIEEWLLARSTTWEDWVEWLSLDGYVPRQPVRPVKPWQPPWDSATGRRIEDVQLPDPDDQ